MCAVQRLYQKRFDLERLERIQIGWKAGKNKIQGHFGLPKTVQFTSAVRSQRRLMVHGAVQPTDCQQTLQFSSDSRLTKTTRHKDAKEGQSRWEQKLLGHP